MRKVSLVLSLFLCCFGSGAVADVFPSRPIQFVVAGPPGNSSDVYARYFASRMSEIIGKPVTVMNRPGGNGFIGATAVLQAPPDGHTIFIAGSSPMAQNTVMFSEMPYDPVKDFRWISGMFEGMAVIVTAESSPYKTLDGLIRTAKTSPGKLNYGSYAAAYRLATEWLNQTTGMQTTMINYKGAPQVTTDLIGEQLDFALVDVVAVAQLVRDGRLRALAVTGDKRHPLLPDVPTLNEQGLPSYGLSAWVSIAVRAETPPEIASKLTKAMMTILAEPGTKSFSDKQGAPLLLLNDEQMTQFHLEELNKYRKIAKAAKITPQ